MPSHAGSRRICGTAGLLFVLLSLLATAMNAQPPSPDLDAAAQAAWFAENGSWFRVSHTLAGLAFLLFYLPFYAGLCEMLREAEGTPAVWSRVAWAGAILSPAAGTIAGTFLIGSSLLAEGVSPPMASLSTAAGFYATTVSGAYAGVTLVGVAVVILRTGILPAWLGWAGAVLGPAAIAGTGALLPGPSAQVFATIGAWAWLGYFLWIAALSIAIIRAPVDG